MASATDEDTRMFIKKAAKHGLVETRLSQLAVERASNDSVRTFAEMLVRDHQHANARLAAISSRRGIMIPTEGLVAASESVSGTTAGKMAMDETDSTETDRSVSGTAGTSRTTPRSTVGGQSGSQAPAGGSASARSGTGTSGMVGSSHDSDMSKVMKEVDEKVEELSDKTGKEFDRAYVKEMIKGHKDSIALFEDATKRNTDAELSGFAQTNLPTLRAHLNRAEALERELKE
jgi:predicted outer membrane protein